MLLDLMIVLIEYKMLIFKLTNNKEKQLNLKKRKKTIKKTLQGKHTKKQEMKPPPKIIHISIEEM